jgi:hypothetical protein
MGGERVSRESSKDREAVSGRSLRLLSLRSLIAIGEKIQ